MKIATSKTRDRFPLSYKKIIKKVISGTVAYLLLFGFLGLFLVPLLFTSQAPLASIGLILGFLLFFIIIILIIQYLYQRWYFAVYFYDLTDDYIVIKKGPITPKEITIPYERVQDVYVDQDIFDRIFGLYDVHLSSATISSGMQAHIDGVEKVAADGLRNELLSIIKTRISKNKPVLANNAPPTN